MKITENELAARKSRITHEAFWLFCTNGIDGVSMKDVAAKAGVAEKSVYRYFKNKLELVISTINMLWTEIVTELIGAVGEDYETLTGLEQVERLLKCFRHLFENYSDYVLFSYDYKLFLIQNGAYLGEDMYMEEIKPMHDMYIRALNKGMKDGSVRLHTDTEDTYYAIWGLIRGYVVKIVIYDQMYGGTSPWLSRFDLACSLVLKGLKYNT